MQLLRQIEAAARGVAAIHAAGLVHGDLKPGTILRFGNRALVSDLKLAAEPGLRPDASYTPKFAAPEQILEEAVTPAADVYALGVTFYTLFIKNRFPALLKTGGGTIDADPDGAGESLSAITSVGDVLNPGGQQANRGEDAIVGAKVSFRSKLSRVIEGVHHAELIGELLSVIGRATDLNPGKRYPHAGAFADDVKRLIDAGVANT
jgi:serine/threonine protein kinase